MADTTQNPGEAVAAACAAIGDPKGFAAPVGYPDSLALSIVDSIWSMGVKYSTVTKVCNAYGTWLSNEGRGSLQNRTAKMLAADIESAGGSEKFANAVSNHNRTSTRNGVLKAEAVLQAAQALSKLGVETPSDLHRSIAKPDIEAAWRAVPGQRSGVSFKYLLILSGYEDVKADRMICRFVAKAIGKNSVSTQVAYEAVREALPLLQRHAPDLTLRALDHAIWNHQRSR